MAVIGATQLEPVNILGSYVQGMEIGRANRLAEQQQAAQMRAVQQETALRNYLATADLESPEVQNELLRFGAPGATLAKTLGEMRSADLTRQKTMTDIEAAGFKRERDLLASVNDQSTYDTWRQGALQTYKGVPGAEQLIPAKFSPETKERLLLTADQIVGRMPMSPEQEEQKTRIAAAGSPRIGVQAYTPASETIQEEAMKELRDTYKQLKTAKVDISNLRQAADLAKTSGRKYMGTGGSAFLEGAKFLKNRLGVDVDTNAIVNAETARTALFQNVLNNLRKLDAQPSQEQQRIMQEALGNLNTDPDALESVVRVYEDVIRGRVELHNKSVDESVQSGIKMPYSLRIDLPPPRDKIAPPPPEAIAELRANPALKKQFDEVFGAGAADRALKGGR
jgi:hypothetical protein